MKKLILLLAIFVKAFMVQAADYAYLTFETTDGAKISVSASSLAISISGTTLTAGKQTFTLSNLSKMYFSATDMTNGISAITMSNLNESSEIYDLNGRKVAKDKLAKGVYIVKNKNGNFKIAVK